MPNDGNGAYTPSLYNAEDAHRGPYAARVSAFVEDGLAAGLTPARDDATTTALVLVDFQHDFVDPTGSLAVPGAPSDIARLLTWFYAHAGAITSIYASLDTHLPNSIFFREWWRDPRSGAHPQPYTPITVEDMERGVWEPVAQVEWSREYLRRLRQGAKKDLMIWPAHTMEGTLGHMLVAPLSEAIAWHSAARHTLPIYLNKGRTPRTEFYGIFGAEVPDPTDPRSALNTKLLDTVLRHDRIYIAGEAKSHCVVETLRQIVAYTGGQSEALGRVHILRDCMSSVAHPTIDFDALTEREFAEFERLGIRFMRSDKAVEA